MTDIVEPTISRPYVEILVPGPQGAPGTSGGEFLVHTGSAYPARSSVDNPVVFVGPVDPGVLLLDGDAWVDTGGDSPVTSVNGEIGAVVLSAADVDALPDTYVPDYTDLTNAPDFQTQINSKLDTVTAPELIRDTMGTALTAGSNVTITPSDVGNTITIASSGGGGGAVASVNGQTGVVVLSAGDVTAVPTSRTVNGLALTANITLNKSNVGLGSVDNTLDSAKVVASAAKLTTARTINGVAFDGTGNITVPVTASFLLSGNVAGDLITQDLIAGGIRMAANVTVDKLMLLLDKEPRGTDSLIVQVLKRTRLTGVDSVLGTATFAAGTKRAVVSGLATGVVTGDSLMLRCTQTGDDQPGSDLSFILSDSLGTSFPTALTAPANPTGFTAVASGAADVALAWTAPASGVYFAVDIHKDGSFLTRIGKGTNSYLDTTASDDDHTYTLYAVNTDITSSGVNATYTQASGIGNPVFIGSGVTAVSGTTVTMTAQVPVPAGDMILLALAGTVPTGLSEVWTVTDARSNTWANHVHAYDNTSSQQTMIASTRVTTNIQVGDLITVTGTNATARLAIGAYSVSGIAAASRLDKTQSNTPATATRNMTTNATAALVQANEIAFSTFSAQAASLPTVAGSGWLIGTPISTSAGSNDKCLIVQWRITSSTTALTGTSTLNTASVYAGAIATFKG